MNVQSIPKCSPNHRISYSRRPTPVFVVWTYAQDICPYTHEPVLEKQVLAQDYTYPKADRLKEIADLHKVPIQSLTVSEDSRYY